MDGWMDNYESKNEVQKDTKYTSNKQFCSCKFTTAVMLLYVTFKALNSKILFAIMKTGKLSRDAGQRKQSSGL